VTAWFWHAVVPAALYGAHQIFTRLASERIGNGLGGFVVEATAALSILIYLAFLWVSGRVEPEIWHAGFQLFSSHRDLRRRRHDCVFPFFQKGGPLSAVPIILAAGAAMMAIAG
jgi:transporter family protein